MSVRGSVISESGKMGVSGNTSWSLAEAATCLLTHLVVLGLLKLLRMYSTEVQHSAGALRSGLLSMDPITSTQTPSSTLHSPTHHQPTAQTPSPALSLTLSTSHTHTHLYVE